MPRAPRRFAIRHRDGNSRLASLSYLTADPAQREAAYGLVLPAPASPTRIGLVLALARLLAAFEVGDPVISHGDLSTKNVLWSLQRGEEVFVIDCDNSERFSGGVSLGNPGRRRAMTPNWDDPAVPRGSNPTHLSDRYSLALVFLRVVGAANFPVQARQRSGDTVSGDTVSIDFSVPPGPLSPVLLDGSNPVWDLCARGLSAANPEVRPAAAEWVDVLEALLQGRNAPPSRLARPPLPTPPASEVEIRPVPGAKRPPVRRSHTRTVPVTYNGGGLSRGPTGGASSIGASSGGVSSGGQIGSGGGSGVGGGTIAARNQAYTSGPTPVFTEVWGGLRKAIAAWLSIHRRMIASLWSRDRRLEGVRTAAFCALIDLGMAVIGLFLVAMIVSPFVGI